AHAAREHDGLVVAAVLVLEGAEVAAEIGTAELVVEGGGADRRLEHDVERGGDVRGLAARGPFPRMLVARDAQIRSRIAHEPGLGLPATAGRAFVADPAARAGRRSGKRRDRGRIVVRLDLPHRMRAPGTPRPAA